MRIAILTLLIFANIIICKGQNIIDTLETKAKNNQIPEKWNMELFNSDKEWLKNKKPKPINALAFPVEKYEYYVFSQPFNFQLEKSHFSGISFGENIGGKESKFMFKHELTVIFFTGNKYEQINADVSSRNYPYLTVQGQIELMNYVYDFVGIKSPESSGYLIVSLKSFDLRFGQTIIILPNSDNSFLYLQSCEKPLENEKMDQFIERLKEDIRILEMIKLVDG